MANIITAPESGIYFDGNTAGVSSIPTLTGDASGVAIQYDGYAGVEINSSATGVNYLDRFSVEGANGRLFGVTDEVTGTVFSVNDAAGLPIVEVESTSSHDKITIGEYGTNALVVSGDKVGIGIDDPSAPLDIESSQNVVAEFRSTDNRGSIVVADDDTSIYLVAEGSKASLGLNSSLNAGNLNITSSGEVGIGTTSPSNFTGLTFSDPILDVAGAIQSRTGNIALGGISYRKAALFTSTGNDAPYLDFRVATSGTSSSTTARMRIDANGNVGIGTTNPTNNSNYHTLDIRGTNGGQIIAGRGSFVDFFMYTDSSAAHIGALNDLRFQAGSSGGGTPEMVITSSGEVGIGTTSPVYKLEVSGDVEASSLSVSGSLARVFAPDGATYNGGSSSTGYLIVKLPDIASAGINNMMTGVIRVFDYANNESFDVHFSGYWYGSGFSWTRCGAWIDSEAQTDRNFSVRFGRMTGGSGSADRAYVMIGEPTSTWSYCKFSVINFNPGHSNTQAYKWNSGWSMDISATNPGTVIRTVANTQSNNWKRNGQDVYYAGGTGNVGIGATSPNGNASKTTLHINSDTNGAAIRLSQSSNSSLIRYDNTDGLQIGTIASKKLSFETGDVTAITIDTDQNVGIGTTSPDSLLEIQNTPVAQSQTRMLSIDNNPASNQGSGYIEISSGTNNQATTQIEQVSSGGFGLLGNKYLDTNIINKGLSASSHGNINFATGSSTSATSIVMTIGGGSQKGNVGIGTTSPFSKLTVSKAGINEGTISFDDQANNAHLTLAGSDSLVRLQMGTYNNGSYGVWIQGSYDNGGTNYGTEPIILNPQGGRVGIGTTGPAYSLHVETGGNTTVLSRTTSNAASAAFTTWNNNGSSGNNMQLKSYGQGVSGTTFGVNVSKTNMLWSSGDTLMAVGTIGATPLIFGTSNAERMRITSSGEVGIGTTSPDTKLELESITPALDRTVPLDILTITGEGSNFPYSGFGGSIVFKNRTYTYGLLTSARIRSVIDSDSNSNRGAGLAFDVTNSAEAYNTSLFLKYNGNVGIGTTSPDYALDVETGNNNCIRIRNENGSSTNGLALSVGSSSPWIDITQGQSFRIKHTPYASLGDWNSGSNTRFFISSGGNVGIGTTASLNGLLNVGSPSATNVKVSRIAGDTTTVYQYGSSEDATLEWTCGSYFNSEVVITASQTNGGTYNNLYIRGIWSNNHTSHHWDELEHVGSLTGTTFTITNGQNGSTAASGRLTLGVDYVNGSFATLNIRITDFFGTHAYTIT